MSVHQVKAIKNKRKCRKQILLLLPVGLGLCFVLDPIVTQAGLSNPQGKPKDIYSLFRVMGSAFTWLLFGAALLFARPIEKRFTWQNLLWCLAPFFAGVIAGALAAVLKVVFRRLRPDQADGVIYAMRPWSEDLFKGSGLSMPSEHAAVAFGAAFMLCRMFPKGWPIFVLMAVGCGISRLIYGDHHPSDIFVAGMLGYVVAWGLSAKFGSKRNATE